MGPLLFLLYINALHKASMIAKPIMLTDGANLFYPSKRIKRIIETMNNELLKISNWLQTNKLPIILIKLFLVYFIT